MRTHAHWSEAVVTAVRELTPSVREILLRPAHDGAAGCGDWAPGSDLQVQVLVGGRPQTRSYSLVGAPDDGAWRIAVKRLDDGRGGSLAMFEGAGVQTLSDCRRGECGLCAMDVLALEGEIDHRDVFPSEHEKAENRRICACVSRVVGAVTLDSAFRPDD